MGFRASRPWATGSGYRFTTAKRLVVDCGELNKKSGSIPNMESALKKMASCRYKAKMDKRSKFWQRELLAFITPQGRVVKCKVMPFFKR